MTKNRIEEGIKKIETQLIDLLVELRSELKKDNNWKLSAFIRTKLNDLNIVLEDKKEKTIWSKR